MVMARVLYLTKGFVAIVSDQDFRRVCRYSWHVHVSRGTKKKPGQPYARATIKGKKVYLHRFVTGAEDYLQVDHKNHQTLDCRRENLEVVPHKVNQSRRRNCQANIHKKIDDPQKSLDFVEKLSDHNNNVKTS